MSKRRAPDIHEILYRTFNVFLPSLFRHSISLVAATMADVRLYRGAYISGSASKFARGALSYSLPIRAFIVFHDRTSVKRLKRFDARWQTMSGKYISRRSRDLIRCTRFTRLLHPPPIIEYWIVIGFATFPAKLMRFAYFAVTKGN